MAVLQKGRSNYPFWGSSVSLITGLDPLGLQNTSEATYASMLPGISNLTNRMRYYGFYCWLLDFYFQMEKKGNSVEQYRFIRRAELMMAILMQSRRKTVQQITGSNFAANLISNQTGDFFDLAEGADKDDSDKSVYWKYDSGAFGQYYYGAMRALSLVVAAANKDGDIIYNVSSFNLRQKVCGKQLADAFNKTLDLEAKNLFYKNIKSGTLLEKDIDLLIGSFYIDRVNTETDEWKLYIEMLTDKDDPSEELEELFTYHRRETITNILNGSIKQGGEYNWYNYLLNAYSSKTGRNDQKVSETDKGWYCYQLNEYWQYGCGSIFWASLQRLYISQSEQYLPSFIKDFSSLVTKVICQEIKTSSTDKLEKVLKVYENTNDEETIFEQIETNPSSDPSSTAARAFLLLFQLASGNKDHLHALQEYMGRKQTSREGNMVTGLMTILENSDASLEAFVQDFILKRIIYRHQMVAMRKMGNGSQSTQKFIIDDQYIRFIDTFPPRNTSPRMNALLNIVYDLQIVDDNNLITNLADTIVKN